MDDIDKYDVERLTQEIMTLRATLDRIKTTPKSTAYLIGLAKCCGFFYAIYLLGFYPLIEDYPQSLFIPLAISIACAIPFAIQDKDGIERKIEKLRAEREQLTNNRGRGQ